MQYYKFDKTTGDFIEPVNIEQYFETFMQENPDNPDDTPFFEPVPDDVTDVPPPCPCYRPQWNGEAWVEAAPKPAINEMTEAVSWDSEARSWNVAPISEPELSDDRIAEIALTAVSELAEKLNITLDSIPEAVAERAEERRVIESRMKAL